MSKEPKNQIVRDSKGYLKYAITDIDGIVRAKYVQQEKVNKSEDTGIGFCDVIFGWDAEDKVYEKNHFTGWHTGFPDVPVFVDPSTKRAIPWEDNIPFYLADLSGKHPVCPRSLLRKVVQKAKEMGFDPMFSQEFEWFNFFDQEGELQPISKGMFGYSQIRTAEHAEYCNALLEELQDFDVPLEGLHTETGPGVYEAAISYTDAITAADRAVLFKLGVKKISFDYGMKANFMAKWNAEYPGCSGHVHQNLLKNAKNAFLDPKKPNGLSDVMQQYIAGQLAILPYLLPMLLPTINSYKRLVSGSWAPTTFTWGIENRTCALRVINMKPQSTRLETRIPGADSNPYLAMAACLAAGLYGIENKLSLNDQPIKGNAYELKRTKSISKNLKDATLAMSKSKVVKDILGEGFVEHFVNSRFMEWDAYEKAVTDWELKRYGEII